jgi:hypothetical protein
VAGVRNAKVPCTSVSLHAECLVPLDRLWTRTRSAPGPLGPAPDECEGPLSVLASGLRDVDCYRALALADDLVSQLASKYDFESGRFELQYPDARGNLRGTLVACLDEARPSLGAEANTMIESIWGEARQTFVEATAWQSRQRSLRMAWAATKALSQRQAQGRVYKAIWQSFDTYTARLLAAYEAGDDRDVEPATLAYLDLLQMTVVAAAGSKVHTVDPETAFLLARAARVALKATAATAPTERAKRVRDWADMVAKLCQIVLPDTRPAGVQKELDRCAATLEDYARHEASYAVRPAFAQAMDQMWLIRNHPMGNPRRRADLACTLKTDQGEVLEGLLLNVCLNRFRGFAVDLEGLAYSEMAPRSDGTWGNACDDAEAFSDRETRVNPVWVRVRRLGPSDAPEPAFDIRAASLEVPFAHVGRLRRLQVPCRVLRGWTLSGSKRGVGLALLTPEDGIEVRSQSWKAWCRYVRDLPRSGRYDPEDPVGRNRV